MSIHPSAVIDSAAQIGENVIIHPFTVIEADVVIGDGCELGPHAVIKRFTSMGVNNRVSVGAVLGDFPQDLKFHGEESYLTIGDHNHIREYVTLHRATGDGNTTTIGNECMFMAYSHVGHNASVGNGVMFSNYVALAGHALVEDFAVLAGFAAVHQFTRVGTMTMLGGYAGARIDVPPYMLAEGTPARPVKLNTIALQRRGVSEEGIQALRKAFKIIYRSDLNTSDALKKLYDEMPVENEVARLAEFLIAINQGHRGRAMY